MAERMKYYVPFIIFGMTLCGALNTILIDLQNQTRAKGVDNYPVHNYNHPFVQTLFMFFGEILCLIAYYIQVHRDKRAALAEIDPGQNVAEQFLRTNTLRFTKLHDDDGGATSGKDAESGFSFGVSTPNTINRIVKEEEENFRPVLMLIPAACDLAGTTLSGVGLVLLKSHSSIWQMLRGSIILFTGIFSRVFLKNELHNYSYFGMLVVIIGLTGVGYSGVKAASLKNDDDDDDSGSVMLGMVMVIIGMMMNAIQFVVEEVMLKDKKYPPLKVVGWEGIWGALLTTFVALPICYFIRVDEVKSVDGNGVGGRYENFVDAFLQLWNSPALMAYSVSTLFTISTYNYFGLSLSKTVSSLTRAVLDSLRTVVIWAFMVFLFYQTDSQDAGPKDEQWGEQWTKYSIYEVIGFVLLVVGTQIYAGVLKLPCFDYSHLDSTRKRNSSEFSARLLSKDNGRVNSEEF